MKIIEVRDGFLKFEADSSINLSSFVRVNGIEKCYIAQIVQLKRAGENSIAYAKFLFLYNGDLMPYDKTLPSSDAEIEEFTFDILQNSINAQNPVIAGKIPNKNENITIDASAFNKKFLASIDNPQNNNIFVKNLVKQFNNLNKKVLILDTLGIINANKYTAGKDFKLPLNTSSLAFLYQDCLNDATADSKSLIIEIFRDLAEYSKTVQFLPFNALKTIVDEMVDKTHVFKLFVLKNKLTKFDKLGYFANTKEEVDAFEKIVSQNCSVIDLSKLDSIFQNHYLAYIYENLQSRSDIQVLTELSNVVSKKSLKTILSSDSSTAFITHSKFKYLNDMKNLFDNFVVEPSFANNNIFEIYRTFLTSMQPNTYLIAGEALNYMPLVSEFKVIEEVVDTKVQSKAEAQETEPQVVEEYDDTSELEAIAESDSEEVIISEETEEQFENDYSGEEIISSIDEKSEAVIAEVSENLVQPQNLFETESEATEESEDVEKVEEIKENPEISEENFIEQIAQDDLTEVETNELSEEDFNENSEENIIEPEILPQTDLEEEIIINPDEIAQNDSEELLQELEETSEFEGDSEIVEQISEQDFESELNEDIPEDLEMSDDIGEFSEEIIEEENNIIEDIPEEVELPDGIDAEDLELTDADNEQDSIEQFDNNIEEGMEELKILPINDDFNDFEEIVELDPNEADENDIIVDMSDELEELQTSDEDIIRDVDKVFTTIKDDDISDSDLDFIDELNSDEELLTEEIQEDGSGILEELSDSEEPVESLNEFSDSKPEGEILQTKNSSTPIVPVYDADIPEEDMVMSDEIEQGDNVVHAKYGNGVVEKMIKYGNKTLFSINFDNIGRRLLDPTLTEIKKV